MEPQVGDQSVCNNCGERIVFGVGEPTAIEVRYALYLPYPRKRKPYWFHSHSGNAVCERRYAVPEENLYDTGKERYACC